jgi:two-component system response regulator AlgR
MSGINDKPLRVLIVDDEAPARRRLRELLADCAAQQPLQVTDEARNGVEALASLERQPADIVLLDIRMPEMDGIELAQHLQKMPQPPAVIFTTAYDDYALKAFEVNAIDYLLKPIRGERLLNALKKAKALTPTGVGALREASGRPRSHLSVVERGRILLVPVAEIIYLRAELKYVTLRTATREHLLEESLTKLEQEYGERFVRVHRSCLVAREHIVGFAKTDHEESGDEQQSNWVVLLKGLEETLPVSRRHQSVIKEFKRG